MIEKSVIHSTFKKEITMSLDQIKQVFTLPGVDRTFESKAEAADYLRRPKVLEALNKLTEGNAELNTWLFDNRESVEMAFETGTIKRVTKQEAKKLGEALDYIANTLAGDKKAAFVVENVAAIKDSFRWPTVKRMTDEEKATAARNSLVATTGGQEDLAVWILANKEGILEAFQAGVVKRAMPQSTLDNLAAWRAKQAAEKAAKEAGGEPAESAEGEEAAAQ